MKRTSSIFGSLVDQTSSILAGFIFTVLVARVATPNEFGAYALALSIVGFAIGLMKATLGTDLLVAGDVDDFANLAPLILFGVVLDSWRSCGDRNGRCFCGAAPTRRADVPCWPLVVPGTASAALGSSTTERAGPASSETQWPCAPRFDGGWRWTVLLGQRDALCACSRPIRRQLRRREPVRGHGHEVLRLSDPRTMLGHGRSHWRGLVGSYMAGQGLRSVVPSIVAVTSSLAATAAVRGARTVVNLGGAVYVGWHPWQHAQQLSVSVIPVASAPCQSFGSEEALSWVWGCGSVP